MTVFRRPKLKISSQMVMSDPNASKISARNTAVNSSATHAHCSIEIMTSGQPHAVPYGRVEKPGPYSKWNQMHETAMAPQTLLKNGTMTYVRNTLPAPPAAAALSKGPSWVERRKSGRGRGVGEACYLILVVEVSKRLVSIQSLHD